MKKNKINDLYSQSKTRSFVLHLVRAYLPLVKVNRVLSTANNNMSCCICNKKLISFQELYKQTIQNPLPSSSEAILTEIKKEANLAFSGEGTATYLCSHCVNELFVFVQNKVAVNDKQINFALKKEMAKDFPEMLEDIEKMQQLQKELYEKRKAQKLKKELNSVKGNTIGNFASDEIKKKLGLNND